MRLWYARATLPGAAPSPEFDFAEPEALVASEPVAVVASPGELDRSERAGRLAQLQGMIADKPVTSVASKPESTPPAEMPGGDVGTAVNEVENVVEPVVSPLSQVAEPIQADWGFWVGQGVVLVSELSENAGFQLQDALARNILKAIGEPTGSHFRIQWPVFNNRLVPGNDRAGFVRVVADQRRQFSEKSLVLLGVLANQPAADRQVLLTEALGEVGVAEAVVLDRSLAALSTDPDGKRELWRALKAGFKR